MNAVRAVELESGSSPLEAARTSRGLSREDAAGLTALSAEEIAWLEEGRLYRYRSAHQAVGAVATYAAALGIEHREALSLAGRPVPPRHPDSKRPRLLVAAAATIALLALVAAFIVGPRLVGNASGGEQANVSLPPTWRVKVDVLNGSGDRNETQRVADRVGQLAYDLGRIRPATRFDYTETAVYYQPGADALAERLAQQLCVDKKPLPGGTERRRLVVIVGPPSVDSC